MKREHYETITNKIITSLESGVSPWSRPWGVNSIGPVARPLRHNRIPYKGINVLCLWIEAERMGYSSPVWMSYQQAKGFDAHVRKGETGTHVFYAGALEVEDNREETEKDTRIVHYMKVYSVFNADQIDGLPENYVGKPVEVPHQDRMIDCERFFRQIGATMRFGGDRAFYSPTDDFIAIPPFESFFERECYYSALAHEHVHWTGHAKRLDRQFGAKYGDKDYAKEELVAELGAAFISADLGISNVTDKNHASYIDSWINVLSRDMKFIFTAASLAQKAADYLHGAAESKTLAA